MDATAKVICLVTIHGIGFQQPPTLASGADQGVDGYADDLHRKLSSQLGPLLSDDPNRQRGGNGPIYVQNSVPFDATIDASGPDRLGSWGASTGRAIITEGAPLVIADNTARVAHIALVYADLEERTAKPGSSLEATGMSLVSLGNYATVGGLLQMMAHDAAVLRTDGSPLGGLLQRVENLMPVHPAGTSPIVTSESGTLPTSLRVRSDAAAPTTSRAPYHEGETGLMATVRQLENDVAAYVCRNDLRTRVRGFVRDALCRLAYRPDVAAIVVNSHSNGTPIAYDVLHELTPNAVVAVRSLVTAGSPLRKYASLFTWGTEIGNISRIKPVDQYDAWLNFWDPRDPVADPLTPGSDWRPGQPPEPSQPGLFHIGDGSASASTPVSLKDYQVDNLVNNNGSGLRAHNYWDNKDGFVVPLAQLLERCVAAGDVRSAVSA